MASSLRRSVGNPDIGTVRPVQVRVASGGRSRQLDQADLTNRFWLPQLQELPDQSPALRRQAQLARPGLDRRPVKAFRPRQDRKSSEALPAGKALTCALKWWRGDQAMTHPSGYRPDGLAGGAAVRTQLRTQCPTPCLRGHGGDPRNSQEGISFMTFG
jgi:hypothetical protein